MIKIGKSSDCVKTEKEYVINKTSDAHSVYGIFDNDGECYLCMNSYGLFLRTGHIGYKRIINCFDMIMSMMTDHMMKSDWVFYLGIFPAKDNESYFFIETDYENATDFLLEALENIGEK